MTLMTLMTLITLMTLMTLMTLNGLVNGLVNGPVIFSIVHSSIVNDFKLCVTDWLTDSHGMMLEMLSHLKITSQKIPLNIGTVTVTN